MATSRFRQEFWRGDRDRMLRFQGLRAYLAALGFEERVKGSHHISAGPASRRSSTCNRKVQGARPTR